MTTATAANMVGYLGLTDVVESVDGEVRFPLGVLYPYSRDLQRVCVSYDAMCTEVPDAGAMMQGTSAQVRPRSAGQAKAVDDFLASIATLQTRIEFAPGAPGARVRAAYTRARQALLPGTRTRPL